MALSARIENSLGTVLNKVVISILVASKKVNSDYEPLFKDKIMYYYEL